jgi:methenyltetrahydromethanopterin cyclohydrolase
MQQSISVNNLVMPHIRQLLERQAELKITTANIAGATLIDCGIRCAGGWQAGLLFARICLGGLAEVSLTWNDFGDLHLPAIEVCTDFPLEACMASQYAGWFLKTEDYQAIGSGPVRALLHKEEIFTKLGYEDSQSETAIICIETAAYPTESAVRLLCDKTGLPAESIFILAAPTASAAGSIQIAARSVETGLHKMSELGYDLHKVQSGIGSAPLPPVAKNDFQALGRTNDVILYGASVSYAMEDDDDALRELARKLPSSASRDYGKLFANLLKEYGNFYDIDPMLFSPAQVWLHNRRSGKTFHAGFIRSDILEQSFAVDN